MKQTTEKSKNNWAELKNKQETIKETLDGLEEDVIQQRKKWLTAYAHELQSLSSAVAGGNYDIIDALEQTESNHAAAKTALTTARKRIK